MVAISRKQKGIQPDRQTDFRTGDHEVSSWYFHQVRESERLYVVEGSAPSEIKEEITSSLRAIDVAASTILGTFAHTDQKRRMMVLRLD